MDNGGLRGLKVLSTVLCVCHTLLFNCPFACSLLFHTQPVSVVQKQGGAVHLHCLALPASASVSWRFRGRALEPGALSGVVIQPGTLSLASLQPQNAGSYQCVAHLDTDAIVSRLAQVTIADIEDFPETHRRSLAVKQGDAAVFECSLPQSNPPALPRYRIRGKWLEESTDEYLVLPSGNLQIAAVSPEHQGVYKCGAYNPVTKELKVEAHGTKLIVKDSGPSPVGIVFPVDPVILTVEQPGSLVLECVGSGNLTVRWMKDGLELPLVPRIRRLQNNLVLSDSQLSDAGNYTCSVQSQDGTTSSASYAVEVLGAPRLTRGLSDQTVTSGSSVQFTCETSGNPAPKITWFFNASQILPSPRIRISGSSLRVVSVTAQDQGMYQCLLENTLGSTQAAGRLTVQSGKTSLPVILSPPESGVYEEGRPVSLSCNASGVPVPAIRWYNSAGSVPTRSKASSINVVSQPGSSTLIIQAVSSVHAGKYICEAWNELGSVQARAFLTVEHRPRSGTAATGTRPSVHPVQSDEGEGLHLEEELGDAIGPPTKKTSDKPTPEAPIIISPPQTHKPNTYDLEWRPGRDWGNPITAYFVKYRKVDDMGSVVGSWHTVRVPGSEKNLPLSDLEPSSLYEVLMVARSAAGEGQPAMLTFRTGKERTTSSSSGKNPSKAPVVSVPEKIPEDKTSNTHFGVVIHDRVPEAPDRPTISMASENSVYVAWIPRANGGSPITAFRVEYRKQGRSGDWIIADDNVSPLKLSVEVRNLEPGSTYRFRVIALNNYGESPHSATSRPYQVAMTNQPTSNRPVTGPHITSTDAGSDTQIMVRWTYTPSSNNNTPIQGFYIYYRPTDSDNDGDYKKDAVEGAKRWHMIGQLQPETSYDIKMQCFNEAGKSDYSNVMICETKARQLPGVPTQRPVTPPGVYPPSPPSSGSGVLYLIVGCVLGVMVLILLIFIVMCLWRNRQQHNMQKHNPPGYLYQPTEMNSHMMEYTTLPGSGQLNGGMHASYRHNGAVVPHACHHLHHKLTNGFTALNGPGPLYTAGHSHAHDAPVPHNNVDYEFTHPHHVHNGGGLYPSASQKNSDCMNCQNFCNNNRCYTKANGSFPGGTLPLMHHLVPCQLDSIEMVPLNRGSIRCHDKSGLQPCGNCEQEDGIREETQDDSLTTASQKSLSDTEKLDPSTDTGRKSVQCKTSAESLVCLEMLDLPDLDCKEKPAWISTSSITGDLIHPTAQEI